MKYLLAQVFVLATWSGVLKMPQLWSRDFWTSMVATAILLLLLYAEEHYHDKRLVSRMLDELRCPCGSGKVGR